MPSSIHYPPVILRLVSFLPVPMLYFLSSHPFVASAVCLNPFPKLSLLVSFRLLHDPFGPLVPSGSGLPLPTHLSVYLCHHARTKTYWVIIMGNPAKQQNRVCFAEQIQNGECDPDHEWMGRDFR